MTILTWRVLNVIAFNSGTVLCQSWKTQVLSSCQYTTLSMWEPSSKLLDSRTSNSIGLLTKKESDHKIKFAEMGMLLLLIIAPTWKKMIKLNE